MKTNFPDPIKNPKKFALHILKHDPDIQDIALEYLKIVTILHEKHYSILRSEEIDVLTKEEVIGLLEKSARFYVDLSESSRMKDIVVKFFDILSKNYTPKQGPAVTDLTAEEMLRDLKGTGEWLIQNLDVIRQSDELFAEYKKSLIKTSKVFELYNANLNPSKIRTIKDVENNAELIIEALFAADEL